MRWIPLLLLIVPAWARTAAPAEDTRDAVEAARLFDDGMAMLKAGRYGAASVTFRTLLYVYPESGLALQARDELRKSEDLEAQAPIVRSLRYRLPKAVSLDDVRACFAAREVALGVERPYDARDVERARMALEDLLASKGQKAAVKAAVHVSGPGRSVEIAFTFEKK
ncbi:MAG TPA: hypothetical protein VML19_00790 [Verrucomicrobiae bacterium]|nr:hypothetical protein [Verrucomicrobiae bacterium]